MYKYIILDMIISTWDILIYPTMGQDSTTMGQLHVRTPWPWPPPGKRITLMRKF